MTPPAAGTWSRPHCRGPPSAFCRQQQQLQQQQQQQQQHPLHDWARGPILRSPAPQVACQAWTAWGDDAPSTSDRSSSGSSTSTSKSVLTMLNNSVPKLRVAPKRPSHPVPIVRDGKKRDGKEQAPTDEAGMAVKVGNLELELQSTRLHQQPSSAAASSSASAAAAAAGAAAAGAAAAAAATAAAAAAAAAEGRAEGPDPMSPSAEAAAASLELQVRATSSVSEVQQLLLSLQVQAPAAAQDSPSLTPQTRILFCNQLARVYSVSSPTVELQQQAQGLHRRLLQDLLPDLSLLTVYELAVLGASIARVHHTPSSDWLQQFFAAAKPLLQDCSTGVLTVMIRAVANFGMVPHDLKSVPNFKEWLDAYITSSRKMMAYFRGEDLIRLISSLAELKYRPSEEWLADYCSALNTKLAFLDSPNLSKGMLAFSTLRFHPDAKLLKAYYVQLYAKLPLFDDSDLASTAEAFSTLSRIVKHSFLEEFLEECRIKLPTFKHFTLANLLMALAKTARPPALQHNIRAAPRFEVPALVLTAFGDHVEQHMGSFSGDSLSNSLWGLAMLGYQPSAPFLDKLMVESHAKLFRMKQEPLMRMLSAVGVFKLAIRSRSRAAQLSAWFDLYSDLASRKRYGAKQVCQVLAMLEDIPRQYVSEELIRSLLQSAVRGNPRSLGATRLTGLVRSLQVLEYNPGFAFMNLISQTARYLWTRFTPQEYADLLSAMTSLGCCVSLDPMWVAEFLAIIQCRLDHFPPAAMSKMLTAVTKLPGIKPGPQWLALVVSRVQFSSSFYSALEMCDVIIALSRFGYRPPAEVFDTFVQHVSTHAESLPASCTAELSSALMVLVPGYLGNSDGHQQYHVLQMKLRALEIPARVLLQPIPTPASTPESTPELTPEFTPESASATKSWGVKAGNASEVQGQARAVSGLRWAADPGSGSWGQHGSAPSRRHAISAKGRELHV